MGASASTSAAPTGPLTSSELGIMQDLPHGGGSDRSPSLTSSPCTRRRRTPGQHQAAEQTAREQVADREALSNDPSPQAWPGQIE